MLLISSVEFLPSLSSLVCFVFCVLSDVFDSWCVACGVWRGVWYLLGRWTHHGSAKSFCARLLPARLGTFPSRSTLGASLRVDPPLSFPPRGPVLGLSSGVFPSLICASK